jgi:hypothetical protein
MLTVLLRRKNQIIYFQYKYPVYTWKSRNKHSNGNNLEARETWIVSLHFVHAATSHRKGNLACFAPIGETVSDAAQEAVIIDDAGAIPLGGNGKDLVTEARISRRHIHLPPSEPVRINLKKHKEIKS